MIQVEKETRDDLIHSRKEQVQKRTIDQEKRPKFFGNGEDTMAMGSGNEFEGHGSRPPDGIKSAAGGTKAAAAPEGNKFGMSAETAENSV